VRGDPPRRTIRRGNGGDFTAREITLFDVFALLLRQRYLILSVGLAWLVVTLAVVLTKTRTFTSDVTFASPQTDPGLGGLSGVAAQLGLRVPSAQATTHTPDFYAELLRADETYRRVAARKVALTQGGRDSVPVPTALKVRDGVPARRTETAVRLLRQMTNVSTKRESGIVRFSVRSDSPELSYQLAAIMLELINQFNLETSQTQASSERQFAGARLDDAASELRTAEDALAQFLTRNRQWSAAPELVFEHDRLQRRVASRQQMVTALMEAFARARIEEYRDAPPLTVIEPPRLAALPDPRGLVTKALVSLIAGLLLGITLAVFREVVGNRWRAGEQGVREFVRVRDDALRDLGLRRRTGSEGTE